MQRYASEHRSGCQQHRRTRTPSAERARFVVSGLLAVASVVVGCGGSTPGGKAPTAKTEPGSVRLILNDPSDRQAPADACEVELCTSLKEKIDQARTSIDFAIYGMRDQTAILEALRAAKARGVKIRGVVDRDVDGQNIYSSTEALVKAIGDVRSDHESDIELKKNKKNFDSKPRCKPPEGRDGPVQCLTYDLGDSCLVAAHASREPLDESSAIMHNKFFVFDERYLWTGSTNVSDSGTGGYNANLVTVVDSPRVALWYTEEFEQMYKKGLYHTDKKPRPAREVTVGGALLQVYFTPQDKPITRAVRQLLRDAKERIDIAVFFLTHKGITADLIRAHLAGVKVRVIMDATAAKNGYAKHELLRAAGIPVKIEAWGGKMHMKSAAIDGKIVITGSMNWTTAGESTNDENTIVIHSKEHATQYHEFFERIWAGQGDRWLTGRPDPESQDSGTACTDGSDNDFDSLKDEQDPGCGDNPPPMCPLPGWRIVPKREGSCDIDDPETIRENQYPTGPCLSEKHPAEADAAPATKDVPPRSSDTGSHSEAEQD